MLQRSIDRTRKTKQKTKEVIRVSDLKKEVQKVVNKYIRLRDAELGCISCCTGSCDEAGHFWPMGANGALRYDLDNLHGQCTSCNRWKHGNLLEYRLALVKKIGEVRVEYLDAHHHDVKKWTREELEIIKLECRERIKRHENNN
jgi:5-methylcytosine-specific restriction endonuclease McrA